MAETYEVLEAVSSTGHFNSSFVSFRAHSSLTFVFVDCRRVSWWKSCILERKRSTGR